ncbi:MAG: cysteine methyltransferase [Bacteroidetes bacterium]|nr:MAG: cysteine methyltransferase [Bacteroidota bacterium]
MSEIFISYYNSPYGELILGTYNEQLCLCDWRYRKMRDAVDNRIKKILNASFTKGNSKVLEETVRQLEMYFKGELKQFNLPVLYAGTDFQKQVWSELMNIPYGNTETYLNLSKRLGNVKAIRAVATANGANAISIIVPCHRIIGSDGSLVGYAGGLPAKKKLLDLENPERDRQLGLF